MSKKLIIFDLDGTLLNSVYAIANASNKSLQKYGLKTYNPNDYVNYIGNGLRKMVELILKEQGSQDKKKKCWIIYLMYIVRNMILIYTHMKV